jgi:O-antigen ligase/Flp pilus assembly protein TadD
MQDGIAKQIARWVALGALFLIPLTPLIVANAFFFPFITGKAFFFRILVEIAVAAWIVLALLDKEYRPRFSWIGVAVVGFVAWMFIADSFAINAAKAFWSNFERMEGWVLLAHLLGLFYAAGAVLRAEKKWRAWFLMSLGVSTIISIYALFQMGGALAIHQGSTRIDATLGNSAYLAVYLLFNVFIALWLALTEKYAWLKWSLIALATLQGILIFFTETRGTVIGLVLGLSLAALLTALTAGRRARQAAGLGFMMIVIVVGGVYLARDSAFVQENRTLQRVTSISLQDGQTRFTLWGMAYQGALERPITGWGQEGFNYIFNTYFNPSLYGQESWFDRAHNAFIDWLTAGGFPALLLYVSLFGSALVMLWRSSELSRPERIALTAALVGYGVHNLFVFDNLYSYVYFFAILALIDSQVGRPIKRLEEVDEMSENNGLTYALPVAAVVLCAVVWFVNVPGMRVATSLITALSPAQAGIGANIATFQDVAARPAFAAQEVREQLVSFGASVIQSSQATETEKQQAFTLAVTEMQKQVTTYPLDTREHLQLSYIYRSGGDVANALKSVRAALELSPKKQEIWIQAGILEWESGNAEGARTAFTTAYSLNPRVKSLAEYAAAGNIAAGDPRAADSVLLEAYGTTTVNSDILAAAYYQTKNWARLINVWVLRTTVPEATVESWFSLAAAYYAAGDRARAIATVEKAVELYPSAAESGAEAIKQIRSGTVVQ